MTEAGCCARSGAEPSGSHADMQILCPGSFGPILCSGFSGPAIDSRIEVESRKLFRGDVSERPKVRLSKSRVR